MSEIRKMERTKGLESMLRLTGPLHRAVFLYCLRNELQHDLPAFYVRAFELLGIEQRMATRIIANVRRLSDEALDALDTCRRPATYTQMGKLSALKGDALAEALRRIRAGEVLGRVLAAQASPKDASETTFQSLMTHALQRAYGLRIVLERRNVGRVLKRDEFGTVKGVFRSSSISGAADFRGTFVGGRAFEIEFKKVTGAQREAQKRYEARMKQLGVPYFLWTGAHGREQGDMIQACLDEFAAVFGPALHTERAA